MANSDKQPVLIALGVVGIIVLGYMGYRYFSGSEPEQVTTQSVEVPAAPAMPEPIPEPEMNPEPEVQDSIAEIIEAEPEPAFVLPLLDDSDQLIKEGMLTLSNHPEIATWLVSEEQIRKFVVMVDNAVHGSVPRKHVSFLTPEGPFRANKISEALYVLNESSYDRYDLIVDIFVSIDAQRAVEFYVLLKPLFQEAYNELGYSNKKFDDALFLAIGRLLETPVVSGPIHLIRPVVMYKFDDEKLESLSEVQKQLIRMGPKNTRKVQTKLSEIALELRNILEY